MAQQPPMPADPPPSTRDIRVSVTGAVARITLARPAKLNALSHRLLDELASAVHWLDTRPDVKVTVIDAEGPHFCAGFDLTDRPPPGMSAEEAADAGRATTTAIGAARSLTIASIRGHCIGGGMVIAAACDLRVVSSTARFRLPEVDLGVPLYWTGVPRLVRELGPAMTKDLVLTGRTVGAEEAKSIRFATRLVDDADLAGEIDALAEQLAAKPAFVLRTTKEQVEEASPSVVAADTEARDLAGFRAAFADDDRPRRTAPSSRSEDTTR